MLDTSLAEAEENCIRLLFKLMSFPKARFVEVSAEEFLEDPFEYGTWGRWIDRPEVES
jgi:hypothetical protein